MSGVHKISYQNAHIILKFGRCLDMRAAEMPAKFQNDCKLKKRLD